MEQAIVQLLKKKPFVAHIVMSMKRNFDKSIPTLGVGIDSTLKLRVNPFFWRSLKVEEQSAVLEHEVMHVLNDHLPRMKNYSDRQRYNKAADAAINSYIPNLPKVFHVFDSEGNIIKDDKGNPVECNPVTAESLRLKVGETVEYYYSKIKSSEDEEGTGGPGDTESGKGSGKYTIDDHGDWESAQENPEYTEQKLKQIIQDAVDAVGGRDSGDIPEHIRSLIDEIMHKPKNWKKDLQRFVSRTSETVVSTTRKKPNRRFGFLYPAKKRYPKLTLAVGIDTSGSVSDEELDQFLSEIERIHKNNVMVWVLECDSHLHDCYKFDPKKKIAPKGRGGTQFGPVFEKCKELDIDGLIYLTDGEDFGQVEKPNFPVLWALLKGCKSRYDWGATTEIEIRRK